MHAALIRWQSVNNLKDKLSNPPAKNINLKSLLSKKLFYQPSRWYGGLQQVKGSLLKEVLPLQQKERMAGASHYATLAPLVSDFIRNDKVENNSRNHKSIIPEMFVSLAMRKV